MQKAVGSCAKDLENVLPGKDLVSKMGGSFKFKTALR